MSVDPPFREDGRCAQELPLEPKHRLELILAVTLPQGPHRGRVELHDNEVRVDRAPVASQLRYTPVASAHLQDGYLRESFVEVGVVELRSALLEDLQGSRPHYCHEGSACDVLTPAYRAASNSSGAEGHRRLLSRYIE